MAPVFLPGEFHGQRRLVSYSPWGCKESEMIKELQFFVMWSLLDILSNVFAFPIFLIYYFLQVDHGGEKRKGVYMNLGEHSD